MKLRCIETERGFRYWVSPDKFLVRAYDPYTQEWTQPSPTRFSSEWRLMGFAPVLPFGRTGPVQPDYELLDRITRFKNGRGMYVAVDYDHGTVRQWSDRVVNYYQIKGEEVENR